MRLSAAINRCRTTMLIFALAKFHTNALRPSDNLRHCNIAEQRYEKQSGRCFFTIFDPVSPTASKASAFNYTLAAVMTRVYPFVESI